MKKEVIERLRSKLDFCSVSKVVPWVYAKLGHFYFCSNEEFYARLDFLKPEDKWAFIEEFGLDDCMRVCSHCGKFMIKGYYLANQYACSDGCAIAVMGSEKNLREATKNADEDYYYTEWYD